MGIFMSNFELGYQPGYALGFAYAKIVFTSTLTANLAGEFTLGVRFMEYKLKKTC